jgi:hypothetical protein
MAQNLDQFTRAYLECALWSSTDDNGTPLDREHSLDDLAPELVAQAIEDCADFQRHQAGWLALTDADASRNGHDFWLTRNRHGAGFWDRGYGEIGRKLTEVAHAYGSVDLYIGDDGKIYG